MATTTWLLTQALALKPGRILDNEPPQKIQIHVFFLFSKETASGGSAVLSPTSASTVKSAQPVDVRWDWSPGMDGLRPQAATQQDDELMVLLDLIHRKSVRLRNEVEDSPKVKSHHPEIL